METYEWVGMIFALMGTFVGLRRLYSNESSKLMEAADKDDLESFKKLLRKGKLNDRKYGALGNRPLHIAAGKWGKEGLVEEVLSHGVDIDKRNIYQRTPLHFAAEFNNLDAVRVLLEHGADPNAQDVHGVTPLQIAEKKQRKRTIALLKEHGAS